MLFWFGVITCFASLFTGLWFIDTQYSFYHVTTGNESTGFPLGLDFVRTGYKYLSSNSKNEAVVNCRNLIRNEIYGVIATNGHNGIYSSFEDFAESESSSNQPVFVLADISKTSTNLLANANASFTVWSKNCTANNYENMPYDPLACGRATFTGTFVRHEEFNTSHPDVVSFVQKHPAASTWFNLNVHTYHLWTLQITSIYYIGGYGSIHYIGNIDPGQYYEQS